MSDLTTFRDHCRAMAERCDQQAKSIQIRDDRDLLAAIAAADDADQWSVIADEIDRWLERGLDTDPEAHTEPLWETP